MISTHILDLTTGNPAADVSVSLEKQSASGWEALGDSQTNADGRIAFDIPSEVGTYKLTFQLDSYLTERSADPFFTVAPVVFNITDTTRKYHIPLLLSAFGYSTYRGS